MCLPAGIQELSKTISRRSFFRRTAAATVAAAAVPAISRAEVTQPFSFERMVDLTHTLSPSFPMPMKNGFAMETAAEIGKQAFNAFRWHLHEHIGTHLDAPLHFSNLDSGDRIPVEQLIGPLVVVDIRAKAASDPDTRLTLDDLKAWENAHGPIPKGAIVALLSGWDAYVDDARKFLGLDDKGQHHLPGYHLEAAQFLFESRDVRGIATDTMSLDAGNGGFAVHRYWLGHSKWGLENVANLGQLPAKGATMIVGSPMIAGCTGGPSRVFALL